MSDIKKVLESYKISTSPHEIMEILSRGDERSETFMWQSFPDHRTVFKVKAFFFDSNNRKIKLTYDNSRELIDPNLPIYVKIPFRETIWKGKSISFKGDELHLSIPTEVRMREFRENLRTTFRIGDKTAHIKFSISGMIQNKLSALNVYLKDISQRGMGLFVSESNLHLFKKGQILELTGFDEAQLKTPVLGTVVYQRKAREHKQFGYRIGVRMAANIPESALHKVCSRKQRSVSDELLNANILSSEFRDMLTFEVSKTVEKMKKRPAIAKYMKDLEIARAQDEYIAEHINVLTIICTYIARSMNWVSEASLEKFVYASFMHDAPLFKYPRLAQIKSMAEFESVQGQLSSEETVLFLNSPEDSAKIAQADPAAPPDVAQMLYLQKELPNGQGFYRKTVSKITPMAALFIVAHDLTDEIMRNPEWDMDRWVKAAKLVYVGGHFNKVMQALETAKVTFKDTRK